MLLQLSLNDDSKSNISFRAKARNSCLVCCSAQRTIYGWQSCIL